jgi:hypothetical protein
MATLVFPSSGRTLTVTNRTGRILGILGTTVGPFNTKTIPLRKLMGHPTYMSSLETLIANGDVTAQVVGDVISADDASKLDAPLSGELWLSRQIWTDPVAADVDAIKASFTAPAADTTYSGTQLDGTTGEGEFDYARTVTIKGTAGGGEALDGGTAVINGLDIDGQPIQVNLTLSVVGGGATATDETDAAFRQVTSVLIPADASGSPGAYEIGFGVKLGLARPLTQGALIQETTNNAVPGTPATVVLAATGLPNGTVEFDTAPDGSNDYIAYYIAS